MTTSTARVAARPAPAALARPGPSRSLAALPGLGPALLLAPSQRRRALPFPLSAAGAHRFYLARNGVFQAVAALGLAGGEVIVPAYHHGVEVEALVAAGARPRFARVDARMRLDLDHVRALLGPATRALYVIHYLGFPQPLDDLLGLARARGLAVVEDCALALLSRDGPLPLGSRGDAAVYCLYKSLPVPNGGLLVLHRGTAPGPSRPAPGGSTLSHAAGSLLVHVAHRHGAAGRLLREALRQAGRKVRGATGLEALSTGTSHFDEAAAGVGMSRLTGRILERLDYDGIVAARRRNWAELARRLGALAPPLAEELAPGVCPLFYPFFTADKAGLMARLAARGIETVDFWSTGHPACPAGEFPEVERLRRTVLELPLHQDLTPDDVAFLARCVEEAHA